MFPSVDGPRVVVLIDGGAGSGKSTLARVLAADWQRPVQLVALDSVYPGWGGLAAASRAVVTDLMHPASPGYRRWDWAANQSTGWVPLDPDIDLIIEGCGSLTTDSARLASWSIWCELEPGLRKQRALDRDGEQFAPHWDDWACQEAELWRIHKPWALADFIVRTS